MFGSNFDIVMQSSVIIFPDLALYFPFGNVKSNVMNVNNGYRIDSAVSYSGLSITLTVSPKQKRLPTEAN